MKNFEIVQCKLLPFFTLLFAASACGADDDGDDDDDPPGGNGAVVDAAPVDAMVDARPPGSCVGESAACDVVIGPFTCEAQMGCTIEAECQADVLFYCGNLPESECREFGCTWTSECEGPGLCFLETNELDCRLEIGCIWTSFCDPLSEPDNASCALLTDEKSCTGEAVCEWEYLGCSGTPTPCSMLDEQACMGQRGCSWES